MVVWEDLQDILRKSKVQNDMDCVIICILT